VQDVIAAKSFTMQRLASQSRPKDVSQDRKYVPRDNGFARAQVA
jgi:hypothetical protein